MVLIFGRTFISCEASEVRMAVRMAATQEENELVKAVEYGDIATLTSLLQ